MSSKTYVHVCVCNCVLFLFQINHNLRSFGGLTRNDVQCMMYNQGDGLPETIRKGLNHKVDSLLKVCVQLIQFLCLVSIVERTFLSCM